MHGQGYSCVVAVSGVPDMESDDKVGRDIPCLPANLLRIRLGRVKNVMFWLEIFWSHGLSQAILLGH